MKLPNLEYWRAVKKCQNLTSKVNFLCQRSSESSSIFFSCKNTNSRYFFHIFSIIVLNYSIKNPLTTNALTFLTQYILAICGVTGNPFLLRDKNIMDWYVPEFCNTHTTNTITYCTGSSASLWDIPEKQFFIIRWHSHQMPMVFGILSNGNLCQRNQLLF